MHKRGEVGEEGGRSSTCGPARTRRLTPNEQPEEKSWVDEVVEVALTKITCQAPEDPVRR